MCVLVASHVWLYVTPWTVACQSPFSVHGNLQARILDWLAISSSRESSQPRDRTQVFCIVGRFFIVSVQFSSVTQSCPVLCDSMNCSTPGFPVHHQLPEFTQTHVHWVSDAIQPSHPLSSLSPPAFNLSKHRGLFKWVSSSLAIWQVATILEFQLQHQALQWIFRIDLL